MNAVDPLTTPAETERAEKLSTSIHINVTADAASVAAVIVLEGLFMMNILTLRVLAVEMVVPVVLRKDDREV